MHLLPPPPPIVTPAERYTTAAHPWPPRDPADKPIPDYPGVYVGQAGYYAALPGGRFTPCYADPASARLELLRRLSTDPTADELIGVVEC